LETLQTANLSFSPHQIHGNAGQPVSVTLIGSAQAHSFTIPSLNIDVSLAANETRTVRFVVPAEGITPFYCRVHGKPDSGMHGLLIFH
jgi:uncharacterized cupredoxin-like copper-binding protein